MPDTTDKPIVVNANAGIVDLLTAAGRYLAVIAATLPILLTFFSTRDIIGFIAYLQSEDGLKFAAALGGLVTLAYGLWKTHKRGAQVATVAADPAVPDRVAQIK
jgi:hypothetical protein